MKKRLYTLFFICAAFSVKAQQKNTIIGVVKDSVTNTIIEFASISNINKKNTIVSNTKGVFKIDIALNHLLSVAAIGYNFDTIRVTEKLLQTDTLYVLLQPLSKRLADITVTSTTRFSQYQLDSIERRKEFFINKSDVKIPVVSSANSGIGIGINIDHFYKKEKRKRSALDLFYDIENESYTNYRFTPALVNKYTQLEGEKLVEFMQKYRPSYTWLRNHTTEEDILYYINEKLPSFNKKQKN
jgi:hypothetical protein